MKTKTPHWIILILIIVFPLNLHASDPYLENLVNVMLDQKPRSVSYNDVWSADRSVVVLEYDELKIIISKGVREKKDTFIEDWDFALLLNDGGYINMTFGHLFAQLSDKTVNRLKSEYYWKKDSETIQIYK